MEPRVGYLKLSFFVGVWLLHLLPFSSTQSIAYGSDAPKALMAFQDGTLEMDDRGLTFSYIPFLTTPAAWSPALPQYYGQPVEPVRPLQGLGGSLSIGILDNDNKLKPFEPVIGEEAASSWRVTFRDEESSLVANAFTLPNQKGVSFEVEEVDLGGGSRNLGIDITAPSHRLLWASPGKKERHDWGQPQWEWDENLRCLIQGYSTPVDATRSMITGLWFSKEISPEASIEDDPEGIEASRILVTLNLKESNTFRFGFLHADNLAALKSMVEDVRKFSSAKSDDKWSAWLAECSERIASHLISESTGTLKISDADRVILNDKLVETRQLFLSNGMVLSRPMAQGELPYSLKKQGIALHYWKKLGLDFPFAEGWRDLVRFHPAIERTIPIKPFRGDNIRSVLRSRPIVITAPDPEDPPTKDAFDVLLGYIINGGQVTLVDGYSGFMGKEGWWTEAGATDPADYALRVLGVPVDFESRKVLDSEGLSDDRNTFSLGMDPVEVHTIAEEHGALRFSVNGPGVLLVAAKDESDPAGIVLKSGQIGGSDFEVLTPSEDKILAASHQPELAWTLEGLPSGRRLRGEGFVVYQLPSDASVTCELDVEGDVALFVGKEVPPSEHILLKKVVQAWFHRALLTLPVSRSAHPVVYDGTYTCRIFDVTGTEVAPILFHQIGRGSLAWVGLPVDYVRLGSDGGTDAQKSLRADPCYDLIRMTLAVHDPRQAGGQQAGTTPSSVWTDRLNSRNSEAPNPESLFYAWQSIHQMGPNAGNPSFWVWAFSHFIESLRSNDWDWDWESVNGTELYAVPGNEREQVDLYLQAFRYAVYRDVEGAAANLGRSWHREHTTKIADRMEADLSEYLKLDSPNPWVARQVESGTLTQEIPIDEVYEETALAVALLEGDRFPGGESSRQKYLNLLLNNKPENPDSRTAAMLSVLDRIGGNAYGAQILSSTSDMSHGSVEISDWVPALYGLCLDSISADQKK